MILREYNEGCALQVSFIYYLLFADDRYFFYKAELGECKEVIKVFRKYWQVSKQYINFEKSSLLFSKRINTNVKQHIKETIGIQNERRMRTYLENSRRY